MNKNVIAGVVLAGMMASLGQAVSAQSAADYSRERAERAKSLTTPFGWFSLIALDWLKPGTTTVGSAKGSTVVLRGAAAHLLTLEQAGGTVRPTAAAPGVTNHGKPLALGQPLNKDEEEASAVAAGSMRLWVIERGDKQYLRVKDSNAPALKNFRGLRWYPPSPAYKIEAKWVPFTSPHTLHFLNQLGQVSDEAEPGQVQFSIAEKQYTLTPLSATDQGLWFVMRDLTSARDTDQGGRFLYTNAPSHGVNAPGTVTLDFNEAINPPCAYSPYATCPLAAQENRLPVAIPAGEKRYAN